MKKLKKILPFALIAGLTAWVISDKLPVKPDDYVPHETEESIFEEIIPELKSLADKQKKENGDFDLSSFESFLENFSGESFHHQHRIFLDTTGDGKEEIVRSTVKIEENKCLVRNQIVKDGKLIWDDTFVFNQDFLKTTYSEDLIEEYEQYLLYYHGLQYVSFTEKWPSSKIKKDYFSGLMRMQNQFSPIVSEDNNELEKLMSYDGYFVFDLNQGSPGIHVWNDETQSFQKVISKELKIVS